MVKVVDGSAGNRGVAAWRGRLLLLAGGFAVIANACGGRTVWVEEMGDAGESGSGGVAGTAGDYGGGYAGDFGGGYAGDYGGGGYGGTSGTGGTYGGYGGVTITGGYGGDGGSFPGGTAGYSGSAGSYGGVAGSVGGRGGFAGTGAIGGSAGQGCGAASGSGGGGSPGLSKACSYFCSRWPESCPTDWSEPGECYAECQQSFELGSWCDHALSDFLICMGTAMNPAASCMVSVDGQCYGPGCTADAINQCYPQYQGLLDCISNPRPLPPCPPPPPRPLPPNCGQGVYSGPDYCSRETWCPAQNYMTQCYPQYDVNQTWYCECFLNGVYTNAVTTDYYPDACQAGAALCGYY